MVNLVISKKLDTRNSEVQNTSIESDVHVVVIVNITIITATV